MVISCNVTFYFQFLQYAQQSGHKRCNEIFSVLTKNHRVKIWLANMAGLNNPSVYIWQDFAL